MDSMAVHTDGCDCPTSWRNPLLQLSCWPPVARWIRWSDLTGRATSVYRYFITNETLNCAGELSNLSVRELSMRWKCPTKNGRGKVRCMGKCPAGERIYGEECLGRNVLDSSPPWYIHSESLLYPHLMEVEATSGFVCPQLG